MVKEIVNYDGENDKYTGQMKEKLWSWHCKIPLFTYPWVQGTGTQMMKCLVLPVIWWCNELKLSIGKLWYPLVVMNLMRLMGLLIEGSPNSKKKGLTQLFLTVLTHVRSLFSGKLLSTSLTWVHVSGQNIVTPMISNAFTLPVIHCN